MSDPDFEKITPAEIDLSSGTVKPGPDSPPVLGIKEAEEHQQLQKKNTRILAGIFSLLLFLVLGVIFLLPRFVSPPQVDTATTVALTAPASRAPQVSPYEEAQRLQQREDAQHVLAALLELQKALDGKGVQQWAEQEFNEVVEQAGAGDAAYREQNYTQAQVFYQNGLSTLQSIEAELPTRLATFIAQGAQAILDGQSDLAQHAYGMALLIEPDNEEARRGLARAQVLNQVLELLAAGTTLHENKQFEEARDLYRQALTIDSKHPAAQAAVNKVNKDILDRNFANLMSKGYASLQANNPETAEESFKQALALKPGSPDALAAIKQASDQITTTLITRHQNEAHEHEQNERWQQALDAYDAALAVDPNVVFAREGKVRSESRLQLDKFLVSAINNPLRMAEEQKIHAQVQQVYSDAQLIPDKGPRLSAQLQQVAIFLEKALQPVNVTLRSNGLTRVTIYRVGEFGQFTDKSLSLTPGNYT
ncbi:MAG: tetratricopeptide repeat protein, partial [Pseudomonadales bacterium]|nr:tetratricopeptide repeat protein [Pseudomonadales bacterium]